MGLFWTIGNYGREVAAFFNWTTGINNWVTFIQPVETITRLFDLVQLPSKKLLWVSFGQLETTAAKRPPSWIRQQVSINGSLLLGNWWEQLRPRKSRLLLDNWELQTKAAAFLNGQQLASINGSAFLNLVQLASIKNGSLFDNLEQLATDVNNKWVTFIGQLMWTTTAAKRLPSWIGQLASINVCLETTMAKRPFF